VDDLILGGDSIEEVVKILQQVEKLLDRSHFPIRKWWRSRWFGKRRWVWLGILYRI